MKKMKKRILSAILVFVMTFSLISPSSVMATDMEQAGLEEEAAQEIAETADNPEEADLNENNEETEEDASEEDNGTAEETESETAQEEEAEEAATAEEAEEAVTAEKAEVTGTPLLTMGLAASPAAYKVTEIASLSEEIASQSVAVGATEDDITFPDTLTVTVTTDGEETETQIEFTGVTWVLDASGSYAETFVGEQDGEWYYYDASLPESYEDGNTYTLAEGVELPYIYVEVGSAVALTAVNGEDVWDGTVATAFASGTGTEEDPYQISTGAQLAYLAQQVNGSSGYSSGKYFKLTNDINLNSQTWTVIGENSGKKFAGTFDGDGHTISGLYITLGISIQGLFGYVDSTGTVKNLTVSGTISTTSAGSAYGGVAAYNYGTVENCCNEVNISTSGNYIGGVVGQNYGTVNGSYNTGTVSGGSYVGGVVGYDYNASSTVSGCYNTGDISGSNYVGGVVGCNKGEVEDSYNTGAVSGTGSVGGVVGYNYNASSTVSGCYNIGGVSGSSNYVGGVVGQNKGAVSSCNNSGAVSGSGYVGGVVGYNYNASSTVSNCYNIGGVSGSGSYVGGVVGQNKGAVSSCNNSGAVSGSSSYVGGVVGQNNGAVNGSYNTGAVSGSGYVGGVVGYNYNASSTVSSCNNSGDVSGSSSHVGGVVGQNNGAVDGSYNTGTVSGSGTASGYVGGVVGSNYNTASTVSSCYNSGDVSGSGDRVGGVAGYNKGEVKDSYNNAGNTAAVSGKQYVGGVVGYNDSAGTVSSCYNTEDVSGSSYRVGGVAGSNSGTVNNSYNTGAVSGDSNYVGGVVGYNSTSSTVSSCYNTGDVSGNRNGAGDSTGGVVGYNGNKGTVENSYNTGAVSGNYHVGGVVGQNIGVANNSYNTGTVSGSNNVGGVAGYISTGSVNNSYNIGTVSGNTYVGGVVGYNTATGTVTNSYYLYDKAENAIGQDVGTSNDTMVKTEAQFNSGEVAYLLQSGQASSTTLVWGQDLTGGTTTTEDDDYPVFSDEWALNVVQLTFVYRSDPSTTVTTAYTNYSKSLSPYPDEVDDCELYTYDSGAWTELSQAKTFGADETVYVVRSDQWTTVLSISDWIYGETASPNAVAASGRTVTYTYYTDAACTTLTTGDNSGAASDGAQPVNAGTYYVQASIAEGECYNAITSDVVSFCIAKADPVVADDVAASAAIYGSTSLNDVSLSGTVTGVDGDTLPGAFSLDAGQTLTVGTGSYSWTFTPTDTVNYNTVTGTVSVTVNKAAVTVTVDDVTRKLGDSNSTFTFTITEGTLADGDTEADLGVTLSTTADQSAEVGTYVITGTSESINYDVTVIDGTLTVMELTELPSQTFSDGMEHMVSIQVGLIEVPEALQSNTALDTVEKIEAALHTVLIQQSGYPADNVIIYEVALMVSKDGGATWEKATEENFPANGLTVILPYPDGTGKDTHDFAATHMFTTTDFGKTPGDTENPAVTKTDDGIQVTVTGLSPIAIAWTEISEEAESPSESSSGSYDTSEGTGSMATVATTESTATGDTSNLLLWIILMAAACIGICVAVYVSRRKNR